MTVIDGCVLAVPTANKEAYIAYAQKIAAIFKEYGALRVVEAWGVDVPEGKLTSFPLAVKLKEDETVVFSWVAWESKAQRDAAWGELMNDARMQQEPMPFDGKRMIFGLYERVVDIKADHEGDFIDGFLLPCAETAKQFYIDFAYKWGAIFQEFGALAMAEHWAIECPDGEVTSVPLALKLEDGEAALFSWMYWPDRATRDAGMERLMADPRMQEPGAMPFDGKRMIYGGFEKIINA